MFDRFSTQQSEHLRLAKGKIISHPVAGDYAVVVLPRYAFVESVMLEVVEAFDGTAPALSVGYRGNKDGDQEEFFLTAAEADATTVGFKVTQPDEILYMEKGSGQLTVKVVGDDSTTGKFRVFVRFWSIY